MRTVISRILLLGLVVTLLVFVIRTVGDSSGLVSLEDIGPDELEHQAFRVTTPVRLAIDASGSIESAGPDTTVLAAIPWISRRSDGEVVWQMPARRPQRGTYVSMQDTLTLQPGLYDAYLSSFGDPTVRVVERSESLGGRVRSVLSGEGRAWHGDARRWKLIVSVLSGEATHNVRDREDEPEWEDETVLWRSGPVRSRSRKETLLRVGSQSDLTVRAMGEIVDGVVRDSAYVVRLPALDTVWAFTEGEWGGGASINRRTEVTVTLEPGLYRAVYHADRSHAWSDWSATPPWAPWMWGLDLRRQPDVDIELFTDADPAGLPVITQFACVQDDAELEDVFTLPEATTVVLKGTGEISDGSAYDWGELVRPSGETLFRMTYETTEHAGGVDRNRKVTEILSLTAGTYILRYVSDGSHHCDSFTGGNAPDDESFWGIALYALDPTYDVEAVTHRRTSNGSDPLETGAVELPRSRRPAGEVLARLDRLGNGADVSARFRLTAPDTLRVIALGELLRSERLDYGWIENDAGETVWEMTRGDSEPGGGADKNRRVDTILALDAGAYTLHFITNGRHAFGRFDGTPPDRPEEWGIRVERVPSAEPATEAESDVQAEAEV